MKFHCQSVEVVAPKALKKKKENKQRICLDKPVDLCDMKSCVCVCIESDSIM